MRVKIIKETDYSCSECQEGAKYRKLSTSPFAEIWESVQIGDKSLHATTCFEPDDTLVRFFAKEHCRSPNRYSIQLDESNHIILDPEYLQYINHSCQPNAFFDLRKMSLVCIRPISIDDEIVFFYPSTEWSMAQSFQCICGASNCLGYIRGASYLSPDILKQYRLSDFIWDHINVSKRMYRAA